jgi:hypothetical protein
VRGNAQGAQRGGAGRLTNTTYSSRYFTDEIPEHRIPGRVDAGAGRPPADPQTEQIHQRVISMIGGLLTLRTTASWRERPGEGAAKPNVIFSADVHRIC